MRTPTDPRHPAPDFGRVVPDHVHAFLAISQLLHSEPTGPAFARLLKKSLEGDDYVLLAHLFEEISVLVLHHLVPEALLFDAFGFDLYWDELREDVMSLRAATGNDKFCENFELAAERAREYRADRPPKTKWRHRDEHGGGWSDPPGGSPVPRPGGPPESDPGRPLPSGEESRQGVT